MQAQIWQMIDDFRFFDFCSIWIRYFFSCFKRVKQLSKQCVQFVRCQFLHFYVSQLFKFFYLTNCCYKPSQIFAENGCFTNKKDMEKLSQIFILNKYIFEYYYIYTDMLMYFPRNIFDICSNFTIYAHTRYANLFLEKNFQYLLKYSQCICTTYWLWSLIS